MTGEIIPPGGALPSEGGELVPAGFDWRPPEGLTPMERQRAWGRSFNVVYQVGIAAIVTAGRILIEAKAEIPHGEWKDWLADQTPISDRTASTLMRIAGDANILRYSANRNRDSVLPDDKVVLAGLCGIESHRFDSLVQTGKIHPEMRRGDIKGALADQRHMDAPPALASLPEGKYRAILADPPWPWDARGNGGHDRSGEAHYPTMTLGEIMALDVANAAADDCLLFLWVPAQNFRDADGVMASWGFELVSTAFVWVKDGAPGLGYWTRKGAEICLLGKRGSPKRLDAGVAEVVHAPRGAHSEKPGEVRERIQRLVAGPYLELFAREADEGWDVWGNHPGLGEDEHRGDARQPPAADPEPERPRSTRPVLPEEMLEAVRFAVPQRSDGWMPIPSAATDEELDAVIEKHLGLGGGSTGPGRISEWHEGGSRWKICASWAYALPNAHDGDPLVRTLSGKRAIRAAVREAYGVARP